MHDLRFSRHRANLVVNSRCRLSPGSRFHKASRSLASLTEPHNGVAAGNAHQHWRLLAKGGEAAVQAQGFVAGPERSLEQELLALRA